MSSRCDLDLEDRKEKKSSWHSGSWCCITIPNLVTKCSVIQNHHTKFGLKKKVLCFKQYPPDILWFRQYHPDKHSLTFWTFAVTVTLNTVIPFSHRTLRLMMLYYQTKFSCKPTSSLEDTTEIVIFWLYKPSLWPWYWTQWTNFSAWHSGLWCCINIPGLVTKCSVVQKISSGQTFPDILYLRCDLDIECSNPIFLQDTPPYDGVLPAVGSCGHRN